MQPLMNNTQSIDIKYKEQTKSIRPWCIISAFGYCVACGLAIYASAFQINDYSYLEGIQYTTIVIGSLGVVQIVINNYVVFNAQSSQARSIISLLLTYLLFCGMLGLMFGSIINSTLAIYCGYFIDHDGPADGGYIQISLSTDNQYPSCNAMQNNGIDMQKQILFYSAEVIVSYCNLMAKKDEFESCISQNSLYVEKWTTEFLVQLIGLILGAVVYIVLVVANALMLNKLKKIKQEVSQQQTIFNAQQQWSAMQQQANGYMVMNPQQNQVGQNYNQQSINYNGGNVMYQGQPQQINTTEQQQYLPSAKEVGVPVGQRI